MFWLESLFLWFLCIFLPSLYLFVRCFHIVCQPNFAKEKKNEKKNILESFRRKLSHGVELYAEFSIAKINNNIFCDKNIHVATQYSGTHTHKFACVSYTVDISMFSVSCSESILFSRINHVVVQSNPNTMNVDVRWRLLRDVRPAPYEITTHIFFFCLTHLSQISNRMLCASSFFPDTHQFGELFYSIVPLHWKITFITIKL